MGRPLQPVSALKGRFQPLAKNAVESPGLLFVDLVYALVAVVLAGGGQREEDLVRSVRARWPSDGENPTEEDVQKRIGYLRVRGVVKSARREGGLCLELTVLGRAMVDEARRRVAGLDKHSVEAMAKAAREARRDP